MNNSDEGSIIFVNALKLAMKTIESLHKKVNEQNDIIDVLCNDIDEIKKELHNIKNSSLDKIKVKNNNDEQWNEYINDDEKLLENNDKQKNKAIEFIINKSDKNKIEKNEENTKEINIIRRDLNKNEDNNIKNEDKNIKIQKLVSGLIKTKNECDNGLNKIKLEIDDKIEEKKDGEIKIRRRGAVF